MSLALLELNWPRRLKRKIISKYSDKLGFVAARLQSYVLLKVQLNEQMICASMIQQPASPPPSPTGQATADTVPSGCLLNPASETGVGGSNKSH